MNAFRHALRDVPLQRKLSIIGMLSSGVALLLAGAAFATYELITVKDAMIADLSGAAAIIGHNSGAALAFDDPESAAQTLDSFSTHPQVTGAALYDANGRLFAQYRRPQLERPFVAPPVEPPGHRFAADRLQLFHAFSLAGEPAGTVYIESDIEGLRSRMARYGAIGVLVMLISAGVALLLSARLYRSISRPIADLAGVMNAVEANNDYTVRAAKSGDDELGSLIDGFNAMLDQIQAQDRALQEARDHLERRVADRTRELRQEIAERKSAQAQIERIHRQLMDASRQAGMAEVATNVLHNVGNVLNSVNVSVGVIAERLEQSKSADLPRLCALLAEHAHDLPGFLTADPRGKHVPVYLTQLAQRLAAERTLALEELRSLRSNVDHIKGIVAMQQGYSKAAGVKETLNVAELLEDALRMNDTSLRRHDVEIVREIDDVPALESERHKILQILVNVIRNAKDACKASARPHKRVTLRLSASATSVTIAVTDNGVGIPPENMTRIFAHGFTTKLDGHGFGLHSSALAASELGGTLRAESPGPGGGATFTLELPLTQTAFAGGDPRGAIHELRAAGAIGAG